MSYYHEQHDYTAISWGDKGELARNYTTRDLVEFLSQNLYAHDKHNKVGFYKDLPLELLCGFTHSSKGYELARSYKLYL